MIFVVIRRVLTYYFPLADKVKVIINRNKSNDHNKNKEMKRLYTDLLGQYVRIVETVIKTQRDKLFQVAKRDENNFHYDIQIRVSNDDKKQED